MGYPIRALYRFGSAKKAGLREGDVIVKIDNTPIRTPGKLASALKWKRPGTSVAISYKSDGVLQPTLNVVLGGRKKGGKRVATLGVIHNPEKAAAYKAKLANKASKPKLAKKVKVKAKTPEVSAKDLTEDLKLHTVNEDENHFMKHAKEEMASALELMEDMKGADVLSHARELRAALRRENIRAMDRAGLIVKKHLDAIRMKRIEEEEAAIGDVEVTNDGKLVHRGKRKFAWRKAAWIATKVAAAVAVFAGTGYGSYVAYATYF